MPRGGRRAGAGRPRKNAGNVVGFPGGGAIGAPPASTEELDALREPPEDLPDVITSPSLSVRLTSQKEFWRMWAPLALEQRTLVPATVPGFRELCELAAFKEELSARLQKFGSDGKLGAERLRNYAKLSQRLDAALARFKLTAFARPADGGGAQKPAAANPFAQLPKLG